jgi:hypothetical protein
MTLMAEPNGQPARLSRAELSALTRAPKVTSGDAKRSIVRRATRGLRVDIRVTPPLYGRR